MNAPTPELDNKPIHVVGGGMAGCEAAWQVAEQGIPVILHEMRPVVKTDVHQSEDLAELVCSNSFRSDDFEANAVGVLHQEMRMLGSLLMDVAKTAQVPAGSALAVDREAFSAEVTKRIHAHPMISVERGEIDSLPPESWGPTIIATGPLTSAKLSEAIKAESSEDELAFFDAIAPIVHKDSIDFSKAWYQSRYDKVG
ncbi:MAG: methylenetetrahydrofolate--tRNA-(uracil(54)-C(5))-methyltransferase (FADH(2)-oxidizing) TrmFO, partial [Alphaproteobacteria bacterium]